MIKTFWRGLKWLLIALAVVGAGIVWIAVLPWVAFNFSVLAGFIYLLLAVVAPMIYFIGWAMGD